MLQIKNTLGGGKPEGLYVWKKYEVIPPTIVTDPSFKHYGDSSYARIYIISPNFDVNAIDDWVSFFDGFSFNGEGNSYIFSKSGNTLRVKPSSTTSYVSVTDFVISSGSSDYGDYVAYFTLASALSYSVKINKYIGDKEITQLKTGTFLDYIVSDKETAYPDGGEKGGYWYERVGEFDVSALGITNFEIGSFTLTSAASNNTVNHSLGILPKAAILFGDDRPKKMAEIFQNDGTGGVLLVDSNGIIQSSAYDAKATTTTVNFHGISNSYGFKAGVEYRYAIFA